VPKAAPRVSPQLAAALRSEEFAQLERLLRRNQARIIGRHRRGLGLSVRSVLFWIRGWGLDAPQDAGPDIAKAVRPVLARESWGASAPSAAAGASQNTPHGPRSGSGKAQGRCYALRWSRLTRVLRTSAQELLCQRPLVSRPRQAFEL